MYPTLLRPETCPRLRATCAATVRALAMLCVLAPAVAGADASVEFAAAAVDEAAIDPSVSPCENFYRHACGGFLAQAPVGESTPRIALRETRFRGNLDRALSELFDAPHGDPELTRLATFERSCRAAQSTTRPGDEAVLARWFARIARVHERAELATLLLDLDEIGVEPFLVYDAAPDPADWRRWHGEIGAPILYARSESVALALQRSGLSAAEAQAAAPRVEALATRLREARDGAGEPTAVETTWSELEARVPAVDWRAMRRRVGADPQRRIAVANPRYVQEVGRVLRDVPIDDLRVYLRWRVLLSLRGELPPSYHDALATFPPSLRGTLDDVGSRCRDATVRAMGVEFSRQFSLRVLDPRARAQARRIAERLRDEAIVAAARADWLSDDARRATIDKLRRLELHIGYPDRWPPAVRYGLSATRFLQNVVAARRHTQQQKWRRTREFRDPSRWQEKVYPWVGEGMAAERLVLPNGFPDAYSNSLVMTAAMLLPPEFSPDAAPESAYATFGSVVAHELVHVLELHMFGADGRLVESWAPEDVRHHDERMQCVIADATRFSPAHGLSNPGERQADENVADFDGVRLAFDALVATLGPNAGTAGPDGRTAEQRFFYGFAQRQCLAQTRADLERGLAEDGHGPAEFRVNGPLTNLPSFGDAFRCSVAAPMVKREADVCRVWSSARGDTGGDGTR